MKKRIIMVNIILMEEEQIKENLIELSAVNIFNGIILCIPMKSLNKETSSTLEHEEKKQGERDG